MPKLIISGVTHELMDEAVTIGRGPDNTIVVNDPSISTHHAQLLLEGDTYRLKDLDSTNGTRVNGKPVTETVLRFDDRIRFGAAEARYESSEVGGSKPLPKPEEIKAQFAADHTAPSHFTGASPFRRQEQQNDTVRTGILIGLGIVLLVSRKYHRGANDARTNALSHPNLVAKSGMVHRNLSTSLKTTARTKRLLLFDIDGTLIHSGGAGIQALKSAFKERFGIDDDLHDIEIAGMTDSGIVLSILDKHEIPAINENVSGFLDSYVHFLSLELPRRSGKLLPGVLELLERLKSRPHVVLALLTGNVSRGARLKLEHYGVWHFFEFGAFADDHRDRNELGRFARARAKERHGREFAASEIDVIGDTPRDIACGKALGARTIAVATGRWGRDELAKHHPDFLIDDLSNVETIMDTLGW